MSDSDDKECVKLVLNGYRQHPCGKRGKVERGGKWYCGTHDPVRRAEKQKARDAEWQRQNEEREAQWAKEEANAAAHAADAARFRWLVDGPEDIEAMARRVLQDGKHRGDIRAAFDRVMAREGGE